MAGKAKSRTRGHVAAAQELPGDDVVRAGIDSKIKKEATKGLAQI